MQAQQMSEKEIESAMGDLDKEYQTEKANMLKESSESIEKRVKILREHYEKREKKDLFWLPKLSRG